MHVDQSLVFWCDILLIVVSLLVLQCRNKDGCAQRVHYEGSRYNRWDHFTTMLVIFLNAFAFVCHFTSNNFILHRVALVLHFCIQQQQQQQSFLSRITRVSRYQKKHSPIHYPDHYPIFIIFFHLLRSIASSLFKLRAWQSFCTNSLHVLFGLSLGLEPSTSYSIHFFIQSVSSFRNMCPYLRNLFCCSTKVISSIPSRSLNSLLGTLPFTLTLHIHLTILICAHWSATSFSFRTGQVSLPCSIPVSYTHLTLPTILRV